MTSNPTVIEKLRERAARDPKTIFLPESQDDRTLEAASILHGRGLVKVGLIGEEKAILDRVRTLGLAWGDIAIVDPRYDRDKDRYVQAFYDRRKHKGLTLDEAAKALVRWRLGLPGVGREGARRGMEAFMEVKYLCRDWR